MSRHVIVINQVLCVLNYHLSSGFCLVLKLEIEFICSIFVMGIWLAFKVPSNDKRGKRRKESKN